MNACVKRHGAQTDRSISEAYLLALETLSGRRPLTIFHGFILKYLSNCRNDSVLLFSTGRKNLQKETTFKQQKSNRCTQAVPSLQPGMSVRIKSEAVQLTASKNQRERASKKSPAAPVHGWTIIS